MQTAQWRLIHSFKGEHKLFADDSQGGRIAVADRSGYFPDQTEDGILWLDTTRSVEIGLTRAEIPLIRRNGDKSWTIMTAPVGLKVAQMLGLRVKFDAAATAFIAGVDDLRKVTT